MKTRQNESQVPFLASQAADPGQQRVETGPGWELWCGDCIAGMRALPDDAVDVVITDPPYSQHTHKKQWTASALTNGNKRYEWTGSNFDGLDFDHLTNAQAFEIASQAARTSRRWILTFTDIEGIALWRDAVIAADLDYVRTCIWDKVDSAPQFTGDRPAASAEAIVVAHRSGKKRWNGGGRRSVFRHEVNASSAHTPKGHPTTKPLPLMRELVELFSDPDELILDPFAGSGSTGVACRQLGRRFLGWELNPDYFDIACRRLRGEEAKPRDCQPSLLDWSAP